MLEAANGFLTEAEVGGVDADRTFDWSCYTFQLLELHYVKIPTHLLNNSTESFEIFMIGVIIFHKPLQAPGLL